jgi:hypothetical protein
VIRLPDYLVTCGGLLAGAQPWSIRAYAVGSGTEATVQTAWDAGVLAWWNSAAWLALMPSTTSLTYSYTSTMTGVFRQSTKTQSTHNVPGGASGAALPYQVCLIATLETAFADKGGHGRWYLPAPAVTAMATTGYVWSATAMTDIAAALTAMGTAIGSTFTFQILNRKALTLRPVVSGTASNKPAIQRRRGDKVVPTRSAWTP